MELPQEIITIIKEKKREEDVEMKMKVFEDFIIPYLYHSRYSSNGSLFGTLDEERYTQIGNLYGVSVLPTGGGWYGTSFTLTAIKRVCKRLKTDIRNGSKTGSQYLPFYFDNKRNPFK